MGEADASGCKKLTPRVSARAAGFERGKRSARGRRIRGRRGKRGCFASQSPSSPPYDAATLPEATAVAAAPLPTGKVVLQGTLLRARKLVPPAALFPAWKLFRSASLLLVELVVPLVTLILAWKLLLTGLFISPLLEALPRRARPHAAQLPPCRAPP